MSKPFKLPTLLVVTDNPSIRFWIKKHLDEQFFVLGAERRQEALEALNARLDFIIVDAAFEECDALDLCKELSKLTHKNLVPILLITGKLKKSFREHALESGVTDFLSDQLDIEELQMRIDTGLKTASARQKTEDIGLLIKVPKLTPNTSLKKKFLLNDQALRLIAHAKEEKTPIALLLLRIDSLEKFQNPAEISSLFAEFVNQFLRVKDVLLPSPEGGFIILLSNTPTDIARKVAEKLRGNIQKHPFEIRDRTEYLTVSIAVSSLEASEKGFNKMLDSAAKSLKTQSKTNLIISLDPETP